MSGSRLSLPDASACNYMKSHYDKRVEGWDGGIHMRLLTFKAYFNK